MTPRDFGPPTHAPRAHFAGLAAQGHSVALVFGSEDAVAAAQWPTGSTLRAGS